MPAEGPRPSTDLRHDAARRRAVAGHLAEHDREARDRPPARAPGRRRHRGRLPDRLARRLRGRAGHRPRGPRPDHRRPGARQPGRRRARLGGGPRRRAPAHPHLRLDVRHPHRAPAAGHARGRQGPGPRLGGAGQGLLRRRRVLADGRHARRPRLHRRGAADRDRRGRHDDQHPRHRRLRDAAGVRRVPDGALRARARPARRRALGALPRRPRAGRGQLVRRRRWPARARSSARSTASASAPATRRSRRS